MYFPHVVTGVLFVRYGEAYLSPPVERFICRAPCEVYLSHARGRAGSHCSFWTMHLFRAIGRRIHCALWTEVRISLGYGAHMHLLRVREEGARNCAAKLSKSKFNSANCIDYLRPTRDGKLSRDLLWGDYGRSYPYADPLICRRSLHLSET